MFTGSPVVAALATRLQTACIQAGITVAVAESCTGGLVAHAITLRPGASNYFVGGVVSYADEVKQRVLGVPAGLLADHGAVSPEVARSMAAGVRTLCQADLAVAVTGVAGPDGGTTDKPVGLVFVGLAEGEATEVRRFQWTGDRATNIEASATAALAWLVERAESASATGPAQLDGRA